METDVKLLARQFKSTINEHRLALFITISRTSRSTDATRLSDRRHGVGLENLRPPISHHVRTLESAQLIDVEKMAIHLGAHQSGLLSLDAAPWPCASIDEHMAQWLNLNRRRPLLLFKFNLKPNSKVFMKHAILSRTVRLSSMALAIAALSACAVMTSKHEPLAQINNDVLNLPTTSGQTLAQWPHEGWWRAYNDATLNRLIEQALADGPVYRFWPNAPKPRRATPTPCANRTIRRANQSHRDRAKIL